MGFKDKLVKKFETTTIKNHIALALGRPGATRDIITDFTCPVTSDMVFYF